MAVQFAYLFGEAISDWTDTVKTAQINSVFAEVIAPHTSDPTNASIRNLYVEVIHDVIAVTPAATLPILIACT